MTSNYSSRRRQFFSLSAVAVSAGLSACSNSPFSKTFLAHWRRVSGEDAFTREQVEQMPYAAMAAAIGEARRAMLVLGRVSGDDLHWVAADKGVLVTRHGRLVGTFGLADGDLVGSQAMEADPLGLPQSAQGWRQQRLWRRTVDLRRPGRQARFGVLLTAEWIPGAVVLTDTYHGPRMLRQVVEICVAGGLDWRFENRYWVDDESGEVVLAEQHHIPGGAPIQIEILKPYSPVKAA